jgi:hypothetical protein
MPILGYIFLILKVNFFIRSFFQILHFLSHLVNKILGYTLFQNANGIILRPECERKANIRKTYRLVESFETKDEAFNRMKLELDGYFYHFR